MPKAHKLSRSREVSSLKLPGDHMSGQIWKQMMGILEQSAGAYRGTSPVRELHGTLTVLQSAWDFWAHDPTIDRWNCVGVRGYSTLPAVESSPELSKAIRHTEGQTPLTWADKKAGLLGVKAVSSLGIPHSYPEAELIRATAETLPKYLGRVSVGITSKIKGRSEEALRRAPQIAAVEGLLNPCPDFPERVEHLIGHKSPETFARLDALNPVLASLIPDFDNSRMSHPVEYVSQPIVLEINAVVNDF